MKRIDSKSAEDASPVEISIRIIDALIDAVKSQEGEIIITFKKDLKNIGDTVLGTGVRIQYGGCNTFVETLESGRGYVVDTFNLTGVFQFLSKALVQREEEGENEARIKRQNEFNESLRQDRERFESATELANARDADFLAKMENKDSADAE